MPYYPPPSVSGGTSSVPTLIDVGESFTVAEDRQVGLVARLINDGDLIVDGDLVEVF